MCFELVALLQILSRNLFWTGWPTF